MKLELLFVITFVIRSIKIVAAADVTLECPTHFKNNESNTVRLLVDREAVRKAKCAGTVSKVFFSLKQFGKEASSTLCTTDLYCGIVKPVPEPTLASPKAECGCVENIGDKPIFELKYLGNETRDINATFVQQICHFLSDENRYSMEIKPSCKMLSFGHRVDDDDNTVTIIIIVVVLIVIVVSVGIFVIARKRGMCTCHSGMRGVPQEDL